MVTIRAGAPLASFMLQLLGVLAWTIFTVFWLWPCWYSFTAVTNPVSFTSTILYALAMPIIGVIGSKFSTANTLLGGGVVTRAAKRSKD